MNLSFKHYYWRWLKNLVFLFLFFAILLSTCRIFFSFFFGGSALFLEHPSELAKAFLLGLRYDLMPLAYINAIPFILLNLGLFTTGKIPIRVIRFSNVSILCLGYFLLAWIYVFDYGFYSYFQDHLNILVFGFFEDDTVALLTSIYKNYNVVLWISVLFLLHYGLYRFIKFLFSPFDFDLKTKPRYLKGLGVFFTGLVTLGFLGRGSFSRLPLSLEDSHFSENEFINQVSLNGVISLNRAIKIRKTHGKDDYNYLASSGFSSWQDAFEVFADKKPQSDLIEKALTARTKNNPFLKTNPPHVVLVVMESFGTYWNDHDSAEFQILGELKNNFKNGYVFKNFLSADNGTIGSIISVTTSQVIRPGARFLSESEFLKTPLSSSGHLPFKNNGHETHFVYGGKLGWRDLGKYLKTQKYDYLWGADEIKDRMPELANFLPNDLGNEWGIFDEYLYSFIEEQLRTATKPQFFLVLTTSNHPPFEFPSTYRPKPLAMSKTFLDGLTVDEEMARKRFLGLQYSNQKMSEFLTRVESSSLKSKTIVALTGDHSFWIAKGVGQDEEFKRYAVPFFLSIPENYRPQNFDPTRFGSHEDIFPTLFNLALSDQDYIKFGEDLFSEKSMAINSSGLMVNDDGAYHHGRFWKWKDKEKQILEASESVPELELLMKKSLGLIGITDSYLKSEKNGRPLVEGNDRP